MDIGGSSSKRLRIIIAGGGTGGHIFPAIAIANAVKNLDTSIEILFVGATGKMEMEKVPEAGYLIKGLTIAGFNRSSILKNITLPFKIVKSFFQVNEIVRIFKPHAVIGVGGYSSYPVLRLAQSKGIPTFIHESNSFAGKSNILLGKKAIKIFVATKGMENFFPSNKIVVTGNPIRNNIAQSNITKEDAVSFFGLRNDKQIVLIVGGSLGAKSINDAIAANIEILLNEGLQLIWQTGKNNAEAYQTVVQSHKNIWVNVFINKMEIAYEAADIIISRAGAMAVAEICVVAKPTILVPYPFAAEDHQTANAMALVNNQAALLVKDAEVGEKLVNTIVELSSNMELQQQLKHNIKPLGITNAAEIIATEIIKIIKP